MLDEKAIIETEKHEFFAPSTVGWLDAMIESYKKEKDVIQTISEYMTSGHNQQALNCFIDGYRLMNRTYISCVEDMFKAEHAIKALNSKYWVKALNLTDVMDFMPSKKRNEWNEQISELKTPEFEEETVKATISAMLNQRMDFLAEMVDGIFTGLSGEHITNRPEGFGKRMIIDNVYNMYYAGHKAGLIHDMRCVIAKFRGLENPPLGSTSEILDRIRFDTGVWHTIDAGAFRLRVYKKGTGHIEINPEISYRLNNILAYLHPMAIPAPHRKRPNKKSTKNFQLIERPIPFHVIKCLSGKRWGKEQPDYSELQMGFDWSRSTDKHLRQEVDQIIEAVGGVFVKQNDSYVFGYKARKVVNEMLNSALIPDSKSHQFYPTPENIAADAVRFADIKPEDRVLEPSAGQGHLADHVSQHQLDCIEINPLNCKILQAKGYQTKQVDFLNWNGDRYNKIIMNPPYSEKRWLLHIEKAFSHLEKGGTLVAILPSTAKGKKLLANAQIEWSDIYENEFTGTSINVVIMIAKHQ